MSDQRAGSQTATSEDPFVDVADGRAAIMAVHAAVERTRRAVPLRAAIVAAVVLGVVLVVVSPYLLPVGAVVGGVAGWFWGVRTVRSVETAYFATLPGAPADPTGAARIRDTVETASLRVGVSVDELRIVESDAIDAGVLARSPAGVTLFVTRGVMERLDSVGREAVVARELCIARSGTAYEATWADVYRGTLVERIGGGVVQRPHDHLVILADLDAVTATRYPPGLVAALGQVDDAGAITISPGVDRLRLTAVGDDGADAAVRAAVLGEL